MRSRQSDMPGTRCNELDSCRHSLASRRGPSGPVADQLAPENITPASRRDDICLGHLVIQAHADDGYTTVAVRT